MPEAKKLVRVTVVLYRNPALTEDEFHRYWSEVHGPLVRGWLARHGIVKYTQNHTPSKLRQIMSQMNWQNDAVNFDDADGTGEVWMESLESFGAATKDPYYIEKVVPDEKYLLDVSRIRMSIGYEEHHVEEGMVRES
ncbi:hypothetical protein N7532_003707 [Penicillium argentinense]|uniref:EthD domain-containing protein n=1 Tax=Penicillium argentinense TaxID=1131581 RepID=A0A9W9FMZ6_9EURO|nr:uncharacterized protein N7532_003707 [Penicillium argentinense]KAJ5103178.1 hypothetical protein N7532_003707 [Penicillium argentinense]